MRFPLPQVLNEHAFARHLRPTGSPTSALPRTTAELVQSTGGHAGLHLCLEEGKTLKPKPVNENDESTNNKTVQDTKVFMILKIGNLLAANKIIPTT